MKPDRKTQPGSGGSTRPYGIRGSTGSITDCVLVEEPLSIQLGFGPIERRQRHIVSVTMRTPGHDEALAAGFLFAEGLLDSWDQIRSIGRCDEYGQPENTIRVELHTSVPVRDLIDRRVSYSSCGVCGRQSIDDLLEITPIVRPTSEPLSARAVNDAAGHLATRQSLFQATGASHAAALLNSEGMILQIHEDAGRHNALDKLVGAALRRTKIPLADSSILLSGRISFEMVAKALRAGCPALFAIGGPTSLAIDAARRGGMTLAGFVREGRFNLYSGPALKKNGLPES